MKARTVIILGGLLLIGSYAAMSFKPRGIRNNNPGNIRLTDIPWYGKVPNDLNTDGEFEQFYETENGIRAMARNLRTSYTVKGLQTIRQMISAWAPSSENNTAAYVQSVSSHTGIDPDVVYPESKITELVAAIIKHENGVMPYDQATLVRGVKRAGWV